MMHPLRSLLIIPLTAAAVAAPHRYDHVVIVVEENRTPGEIVGDQTNAPYITSLAAGGVNMGNMFAHEHPSQPNYLQLFSGSNQGVLDDELPPNFSTTPTSTYPFTAPNLGRELINAGFTFAGYSEQLEAAGAADWADYDPHTATAPGVKYRRKHNPWANWVAKVSPLPANQLPAAVNKAFTQFPADFTQLPTVSFVVPNQDHDMHDGSRKAGDDWLRTNLDAYAQWARTHNSLLIITWDEDDYKETNAIPTVLYGASLKNGTVVNSTWTLHNLLRTLEDMYGSTSHAGAAAQVRSIVGPFSDDPPVSTVTFRQGLNGYTGARDTALWEETPDASKATVTDLTADLDTTTAVTGDQEAQILVRFDNLFGSAAGQIPAGAVIRSAKLLLNTPANTTGTDYDSDSTFRAHRMVADWTDSATWNSMAGGVSANNTEAATTASFSLVPDVDGGPAVFDVTADVELFQSGTANRGWVLRVSSSSGDDGWTVKSSEYATDVTLRPALEITYSPPGNSYAQWTAANALAAPNDTALADPDHDSLENVLEFAFNLDPRTAGTAILAPGGSSGLPAVRLVTSGAAKVLEIEYLRRTGLTGTALTYTPQFSSSLSGWTNGGTPQVTAAGTGWERVIVRDTVTTSASARRFARVLVSLTP